MRAMRLYVGFIYVFLYAPIALIIIYSFNSGRYAMDWQGFSTEWYGKALSNPLIVEALITSVIIAGATALLSAVIGTLAALGLQRASGFWRNVFDGLIYIAIMVPSVVIGIATLVAFVTLFDIINPFVEAVLVLTDGYEPVTRVTPPFRTLWGLIGDFNRDFDPGFGEIVEFEFPNDA